MFFSLSTGFCQAFNCNQHNEHAAMNMNKMLIYDFECVVEWDAKRYRHLLDFQLPLKKLLKTMKEKKVGSSDRKKWLGSRN